MARSLARRWRESPGWQTLELFAHLLGIGGPPVAIVLGFELWGGPGWQIYAGGLAALWITAVREGIDGLPIESVGDAIVDSVASILGGVLVGVLFWALG